MGAARTGAFAQDGIGQVAPAAHEPTFRASRLESRDGTPLSVFEAGKRDNPALVLINAYGIPVAIWEPFAKALCREFYLLTWESRDIPNYDRPFDAARCGLGSHADDLGAVLDSRGLARASLVGWCSGAQVALRFATEAPGRVEAMTFLSGNFRPLDGVPATEFHTMLNVLLRKCAGNAKRCETYWRMLFGGGVGRTASGTAGTASSSPLASAWAHVPAEVESITAAPYQSPESLYRYATTQLALENEPEHAWTTGMKSPVLLLGGEKDLVVHPETWREMSRRLQHSRLITAPEGDHYMLYRDETVVDLVRRFHADPELVMRRGVA